MARYSTVLFESVRPIYRHLSERFFGSTVLCVPIPLEWPMGNTAEIIDSQERTAGAQEVAASQVQKALSDIFKSTSFRTSKQSQQLLQYIVDQTLAGHAELLKERVIGAEVFGRPPDYDTNEDPIVRGRAAEVRKRLAQYYVGEGNRCSIRIEISPGSYHATFSDSSRSLAKESGITRVRSSSSSGTSSSPAT